jgi:hypothetical protein
VKRALSEAGPQALEGAGYSHTFVWVSISVVQFRHPEFVDDEALEVAREDREECDRNEPMRCSFEHSKMVFNRR